MADVLFGKVNLGGKLPVSFPQVLGQVPIYYNHEPTPPVRRHPEGHVALPRAFHDPRRVLVNHQGYRDLPTCAPLYELGFGLSYTSFSVTNLRLDRHR